MKDEKIPLLAAVSKLFPSTKPVSGEPSFNQEKIIFYWGKVPEM